MNLVTRGTPSCLDESVVGIVARNPLAPADRVKTIRVVQRYDGEDLAGYRGIVTSSEWIEDSLPTIASVQRLEDLRDGDIVVMIPGSGAVRTLFRPDSPQNFLFTTEQCNSNCLMCSQPPKSTDDLDELTRRNLEVIRLIEQPPEHLTITGGEPTLLGDRLWLLLQALQANLPHTAVHMLTNGRNFAAMGTAVSLASASYPLLSLGIPLYADVPWIHDHVVQAAGAFSETLRGLHNLARWGQRIEIRVVLHALTVPRLANLAAYIYRNLTFVEHVALMGLEHVGFAVGNMRQLWIDPVEYHNNLRQAVEILDRGGIAVSIYNHPLCVLPRDLWKFSRRSISDWKNAYHESCGQCSARDLCGGLFKWSTGRQSRAFGPI